MAKSNRQSNFKNKISYNRQHMEMYGESNTPSEKTKKVKSTKSYNTTTKKFEPTSYTITYAGDDALERVLTAITNTSTDLANVVTNFGFTSTATFSEVSVDTILSNIATSIADVFTPTFNDSCRRHTSVSISANKVFVKLESKIGFSWKINYSTTTIAYATTSLRKQHIDSIDLTITVYGKNNVAETAMTDLGFTKVEKSN